MRDEKRIDPMLEALGELWHEHPDYRLGQLLFAVVMSYGQYDAWDDIFDIEDDELLPAINALSAPGKD